MQYRTVKQVEEMAAASGVILTPADRAKIAQIQQSERERLRAIHPAARSTADKFNEFWPKLLAAIVAAGALLITLVQTLIVNLGVPVVLVFLLVVEQQRVLHGIMLFEASYHLAAFGAWALVILNLTLEFTVHHVEHKAGYEAERARRWSLRIWAANMGYRLGLGQEWQAVDLSPAERYRRLLRLVTFTILALALAGSMRIVIEDQPGAWYEALLAIVTDSSLAEITVWAGGLLFAAAAVLSAQGLSRYIAIRVVEILGQMAQRQTENTQPFAEDVEAAGALAALALVNEKLAKKQPRPVEVKPIENPTPALATERPAPAYSIGHTYSNGHSVTE